MDRIFGGIRTFQTLQIPHGGIVGKIITIEPATSGVPMLVATR